jgi:hypothetical protein
MYGTTTQRYGRPAAAGVARAHVAYGAAVGNVCVHAEKRNVLEGALGCSWSIPSFMTTAHKPGPRPLVTTS